MKKGKLILKRFNEVPINKVKERFIAFDTETTGLDVCEHKIIQVSAILFENGRKTKYYTSCLNIGEEVPSKITEITGITTKDLEMVEEDETFIYRRLLNFFRLAPYVLAYNAPFDIGMLENNLRRVGVPCFDDITFLDVLELTRQLNVNLENRKMETIAKYYGLTNKQLHVADDDARLCGEVFLKVIDDTNLVEEKESVGGFQFENQDEHEWQDILIDARMFSNRFIF